MKTLSREQFEDLVTETMKSICREVELEEAQFDMLITTVAATMTKCLLTQGVSLPWIDRIRKN
jgi:hypothetical protein